ncbi:hypothetical protein ACROYT_G024182 [Oculina patagonica]
MSTKQISRQRSLKGKEALLEWCKQQTEGYKDVNVCDLTSSWRDGLAFCALLHRFSPELLEFDDLSKEDAVKNNELAFKIAEERLKVPALLDAQDLVSMKYVDEMSVMTYVSMLYKRMNKRSSSAPTSPAATSPTGTGQTRRTLFDVLRDENNFTELCEKRKNRHSSGEMSPVSKTAPTETKIEELQQENHI